MTNDVDLSGLRTLVEQLGALPPPEERKRIRRAAGVSMRELAAAMGVSHQTIEAWESGRTKPTHRRLGAYLEALRIMGDQ